MLPMCPVQFSKMQDGERTAAAYSCTPPPLDRVLAHSATAGNVWLSMVPTYKDVALYSPKPECRDDD